MECIWREGRFTWVKVFFNPSPQLALPPTAQVFNDNSMEEVLDVLFFKEGHVHVLGS